MTTQIEVWFAAYMAVSLFVTFYVPYVAVGGDPLMGVL